MVMRSSVILAEGPRCYLSRNPIADLRVALSSQGGFKRTLRCRRLCSMGEKAVANLRKEQTST
eukprot:4946677-Amphidinium_carterae.1